MDPKPSNKEAMFSSSEASSRFFSASGVWSAASGTIMDTRSEPPPYQYHGGRRAHPGEGAPPPSSDPAPPKGKSFSHGVSVPSSRDPEPTAAAPPSQAAAVADEVGLATANAANTSQTSKSKPSSKSNHAPAAVAAGSGRKSRRAPSPGSPGRGRNPHAPSSSSHRQGPEGRARGGVARSAHARDPDDDDVPPSNGIDPPEGACAASPGASAPVPRKPSYLNYLDPPSQSLTSQSQSSAGSQEPYAGVYKSKSKFKSGPHQQHGQNNQLAVWNEEIVAESEDRRSAPVESLRGESVAAASSLHHHTASSGSPSSRSPSPSSQSSVDRASESRALALREDDSRREGRSRASSRRSETHSRAQGQEDSHYDAIEKYYGEEEEQHHDDALVAREDRYLAKAVDNYQAMVPIDSNIYEAFDHTFVTCPERLRFRFLYTFIRKNLDRKIIIFFSTADSVKFHAKLLNHLKIPVITIHGKQTREKFIHRFFKFSDMHTGILCATDEAGRDLDIPPSVDWVVQFEPPDDPSEYILRVARISCDPDRVGRSLLFLNPGEQGFLKYYHSASIPVSEFEIPMHKLAEVQGKIECLVNQNERMLRSSRDAYGSYLIAHASHNFRDVYNVHDLNKQDVASAFGLVGLPDVDDMTMETETIAADRWEGGAPEKTTTTKKATWEKKEKPTNDTWMKGMTKSWPHSQIKLHPKFTER